MSQTHNEAALDFDVFDRLHKSLRVANKTTTQLAADLGVHRNTISNYLSGRTPMDRRSLIAWAFATGVPVEWLEHGTQPTPSPDPSTTEKGSFSRTAGNWEARVAPLGLVA